MREDLKRIYLVGYMGSGKSTVARLVARRLGWTVIDMDSRIENRFHTSINAIFAERGEAGFRKMERYMLEEVCALEDVVISTGGGTPCQADNMDLMTQSGAVIYLRMKPESLARRLTLTHGTQKRPILRGKSEGELLTFIETQLGAREAYYARAQYVFDTDTLAAPEAAEAILKAIEKSRP